MGENCNSLWVKIRGEVEAAALNEPMLTRYLGGAVLERSSLTDSLSYILSIRLARPELGAPELRELFANYFSSAAHSLTILEHDICAVYDRDPAVERYSDVLLLMKGFHAVQAYRLANWLWNNNRKTLARYLQNRISEIFAVDIHPAAKIGCGLFVDHATSVVVGETAMIANNVSLLHEVTLGGTGKESGDRHPKLMEGVLVGAGAKILGNVTIGVGAKIGAGSVVLEDVAPHTTVAGVPAKVVGTARSDQPALDMDHKLPRCGD